MKAYEAAYKEARRVLHQRGKSVGQPFHSLEGRRCPVAGVPLLDLDVLTEAWGEEFAREIFAELGGIEPAPIDCPDCLRLWTAFCETPTEKRLTARQSLMAHAATHPRDSRSQATPIASTAGCFGADRVELQDVERAERTAGEIDAGGWHIKL